MPLRFKTLSLNDSNEYVPNTYVIPSEAEIIDEVKLYWEESEEVTVVNSDSNSVLKELNRRHPEWKIDIFSFHHVLKILNIHKNKNSSNNSVDEDDMLLRSYNNLIIKPDMGSYDALGNLADKIKLLNCKDVVLKGRGLCTTKDLAKDELIFKEETPILIVPPMERFTLIEMGKACALCGRLMNNISEQFIIKNGLDCDTCINTVWCSKLCLKRDFTHKYLKHPLKSSFKLNFSSKKWRLFEKYCRENVFVEGYIVGHIYAAMMIDTKNEHDIKNKFNYLAYVSQKERYQGDMLTNFEKSLEDTNDSISDDNPIEIWENSYSLFKDAFLDCDISYEEYLNYIGRYNLNHKSGQLYPIYSLVNHDCEPNIRVEIDFHTKELKVFARKPISKGSELFTTYINPLNDVKIRRKSLLINYGFLCNCSRCEKEFKRLNSDIQENSSNIKHTQPEKKTLLAPINEDKNNTESKRRKSSMRVARPDLTELFKNGKEFDLEIPENINGKKSRSASVRFDNNVTLAVADK